MDSDPSIQAPLVPRFAQADLEEHSIARRREWVEQRLGVNLSQIGAGGPSGPSVKGNIENPIGSVQMPLGIAGPLKVQGKYAEGVFYVPMATTEGALVRSYERGMTLLTRSGGVTARVVRDENQISPSFSFRSMTDALAFMDWLATQGESVRTVAESTTRHGKLIAVEPSLVGRTVFARFRFTTGDAHGMNMIVGATSAACEWILQQPDSKALDFQIFSGLSSEKRPSGILLNGGKGKTVVAEATIPRKRLRQYMRSEPEQVVDLWNRTVVGNLKSNAIGYCGHYANGLTAVFIACGQDVANVVNSAVGVTEFRCDANGDLYLSVTLPSLIVATVGGGVALATSRECLEILGCFGTGRAKRFAEIVAATVLAGELSMAGAIVTGEFAAAHERYGRNR